jgi:mono/diheme cytochrome c family protein
MSDENNTTNLSDDTQVRSSVLSAHPSTKREKSDPKAGQEPVSLWAFVICSVALVAGGGYLGATNGDFDYSQYTVEGYQPTPPAGIETGPPEDPNSPEVWRKNGKRVYGTTCNGCHQASGLGLPGQYPPLVKSEWVTDGTERFAQIVLNGLRGPIEVNGAAFGSIEMPPHGDKLNDKQIGQVMSYVRYEFENGIEPIVTAEQVAAAREKHAAHVGAYTVDALAPAGAELPGGPAPEGDAAAPETPPAEPAN